jgi:hypothetical protein
MMQTDIGVVLNIKYLLLLSYFKQNYCGLTHFNKPPKHHILLMSVYVHVE